MWQPMLLSKAPSAFNDNQWLWQVKWDGVRCGVEWLDENIHLLSRNGKDITAKFPEIVADLESSVSGQEVLLDGELICLTDGKPDFHAVMSRLMGGAEKGARAAQTTPAIYMAFDVLRIVERDCTNQPLIERQELLAKYVHPTDHLQVVESWPGISGKQIAEAVAGMGLEGVVGKRRQSVYRQGVRTKDWVKVKFWHRADVFVLGVRQRPFSAVVGDREGKVLCSVNLGISPSHQRELWRAIPRLQWKEEDGVIWLRPLLRGQLRYRTSPTGLIREPVFEGFLT